MRLGAAVALLTLTASALASDWAAAIGRVALLVVFAMALDAAAPVNQAPGQRVNFALRGEARGRINALYMTIVFVLGAGGSPSPPWPITRAAGEAPCWPRG